MLFPALSLPLSPLSLSLCGDCFPLTLGKDRLLHAPRSYHIFYSLQESSTEAVGVTVTWCNLVLRFSLFLRYGRQLKRWIVWGEYTFSSLFNWILFILRFFLSAALFYKVPSLSVIVHVKWEVNKFLMKSETVQDGCCCWCLISDVFSFEILYSRDVF